MFGVLMEDSSLEQGTRLGREGLALRASFSESVLASECPPDDFPFGVRPENTVCVAAT
jgi:hypothetical protein